MILIRRISPIALRACVVLAVFSRLGADSVEEDDGDQYFGVPLGALHFSSDGTSAEIYAADEFTIIFNHFYHNPRRPGCTSMMIGPARKDDRENVVEGHGLLMAPAHPPVTAAYHRFRVRREAPTRARRQLIEQFSGWPLEFDHLLMAPNAPETEELASKNGTGSNRIQEKSIDGSQKSFNKHQTSEDTTKSAITVTPLKVPPTASATPKTAVTTASTIPASSSPQTTISMGTTSTIRTTVTTTISKTTTADENDETTVSAVMEEPISMQEPTVQEPLPIIFFETKGADKLKQIKLKSSSDLGVRVTSSGETVPFIRREDIDRDEDFVRRAPARVELVDHSKLSNQPQSQQQSKSNVRTTTPLYYVIKDPREARRQRLLALKRRISSPLSPTITTTTAAAPADLATRDFDARFELPNIRDKLATFSLTNGAKINQYKWIGLYDQCLKRHIPLVSLRDVDPPREEKIAPLSGWSHNITSYRVHIINCNTILIPSFTYQPGNATANTYFFVGIGEFPNNIERQMCATVVGLRRDEPLHAYNGEDVLLRLPHGFRTFDVDYITVYNTDEKKSYAHVILPSLLVPPCAED